MIESSDPSSKFQGIHFPNYAYNVTITAIAVRLDYSQSQNDKLHGFYESKFSNDLKHFDFRGEKTELAKYNATRYYRVLTVEVVDTIKLRKLVKTLIIFRTLILTFGMEDQSFYL